MAKAQQLSLSLVSNKHLDNAVPCKITSTASVDTLIRLASDKLGLQATVLYLKDGTTVTRLDKLLENDTVYVSEGEPFFKGKGETEQKLRAFKVGVLGHGAVGKSALVLRFVQGMFVANYDPTIEDTYRKVVTGLPKNQSVQLEILDTAGQEDYVSLRSSWIRMSEGIILVYSVANRTTFDGLRQFYEDIVQIHEDGLPPILLVANKCDLKREVSTEDGQGLAKDFHAKYFETSAKLGSGVEAVFMETAKLLLEGHKEDSTDHSKRRFWWCPIL